MKGRGGGDAVVPVVHRDLYGFLPRQGMGLFLSAPGVAGGPDSAVSPEAHGHLEGEADLLHPMPAAQFLRVGLELIFIALFGQDIAVRGKKGRVSLRRGEAAAGDLAPEEVPPVCVRVVLRGVPDPYFSVFPQPEDPVESGRDVPEAEKVSRP